MATYPCDMSNSKFFLAGNSIAYEFDRATNQRTQNIIGVRIDAVDINAGYEHLNVLIEGAPVLLFDTENGQEIPTATEVVFQGLEVRPYVGRNGRIAYSAKASAVRLANQPRAAKE